jgi:hypothetical protein
MSLFTKFLGLYLAANFIPSIAAVPALQKRASAGTGNSLNPDIPPDQPPGLPGAQRSLYGSESLTGPDGNPVNPADVATIPTTHYTLDPGQDDDANLGLYLDLSESPNPQPIRGSNGKAKPGPRM